MKNLNPKHWKEFLKYVNTYDPLSDGIGNTSIILDDMLYGIGLLMDKKKYKYANGYIAFKEMLIAKFNKSLGKSS